MSALSEQDLRSFLRLNREPLAELREDENWWKLGPLDVSKKHPTFRAGFGHPILPETHFDVQSFDVDGRRGCAIVLHSGGKPPAYFAGWVPVGEEEKARRWTDRLNGELRQRLSSADGERTAMTRDDDPSSGIAFDQGHESAPDSPFGRERLQIMADGRVNYERRTRVAQHVVIGTVDRRRLSKVYDALKRTSFPTPPQQRFVPGASIVRITVLPVGQFVYVDYFDGLRMEGYGDVVRELSGLCDALRESKSEILAGWDFRRSES